MFAEMQQAQDAVAHAVMDGISEKWERVVVNYEMLDSDEGTLHDRLGFYILATDGGVLEERGLSFGPGVIAAFDDLNNVFASVNGQKWGACDFVLDANGQYKFDFSLAEPKRINGIIDEESYFRFNNYLDNYIRERRSD